MALDQTDREEVLFRLLEGSGWRERVVGEMVLGAGEHVRMTTVFQFGLAGELLDELAEDQRSGTVRMYLPVTSLDKRALLNFDLEGPGGSDAFMLPRGFIAQLQASYIERLLHQEGVPAPFGSRTKELLEAICVFTPALYLNFVAEHSGEDIGMARYLSDGLTTAERSVAVDVEDVRRWRASTAEVRTGLARALAKPACPSSSSEEVLLALPRLGLLPTSCEEIERMVGTYCDGVRAMQEGGAQSALHALADCGRRWLALAELDVPVDQRFKVRMGEDRPLNRRGGRRSLQRFAMGEAASAHLEIRVVDPSVRLGKVLTRSSSGEMLGLGPLESARFTPEAVSFYSAVADRPDELEVDIELRLTRAVRTTALLFGSITLAALAAAALLPSGERLVPSLAVLVIPVTVTAALLIVREQTGLAASLQTWPRTVAAVVTAALWAVVLTRLLLTGIALPPW